ncbi:MAG: PEGA domain-containing protein, partial [Planctomycetota bacterium]
MAPEQLAGGSAAAVSSRSDLFSLGIVLCELFSGTHPFRGRTDVLTANRILTGDRESVSANLPEEAAGLEPILSRLLEQDPARRPERAAAVSLVLQGILLPIQAADTDPALSGRVVSGPASAEPISVDHEIESARSDLEIGRVDEARQVLVQALKRDATDPRVQRMLDRILQISERQIPCRDYFHALKAARAAIEDGDVDAARKQCECAAVLWEDDYEWREVRAQVDALEAKTAAVPELDRPRPSAPAVEAATRPAESASAETRAGTRTRGREQDRADTLAFDEETPRKPRRRPVPGEESDERGRRPLLVYGLAAAASIVVLALGGWWLLGRPARTTVEPAAGVRPSVGGAPLDSSGPPAEATTEVPLLSTDDPVEVAGTTPAAAPRPDETNPRPAPASGSLRVTSQPPAAEVFIDGKYRGRTPLETTLPEGEHPLRLELTGHEPWDRTVRVDAGGTPDVTARLVERRQPAPGSAVVEPPPSRLQRDEPADEPAKRLPEPVAAAGPVTPSGSGQASDPIVTDSPAAGAVALTAVGLWARAERQRDAEAYNALGETLDELLSVDPGHETAAKWRDRMDKWIAGRAEEWQENVAELLEDFRAYIADRELDNLEEQWGHAMDGKTRAYFVSLFGDHEGAVRARVGDVAVQPDDDGTGFTVDVRIVAKPTRGRKIEYTEVGSYLWRGRV